MQSTSNYSLNIVEGTDIVNIPVQLNPNFQTIDSEMFKNKQGSTGTATEVVTGTVHAIVRANTDADVFRFTATGNWASGDTMTVDGSAVTVHLTDGTAPGAGAYVIGAEVVAVINGTLVTLISSSAAVDPGVTSFNSRVGAVTPAASDYVASMIDYDNTGSGLTATDAQGAIDELAAVATEHGFYEVWVNPSPAADFNTQTITFNSDLNIDSIFIVPDTSVPAMTEIGTTGYLNSFSISSGNSQLTYYFRPFAVSKVLTTYSVNFSDCTSVATNTSTFNGAATVAVTNNRIKPLRILALVHNS